VTIVTRITSYSGGSIDTDLALRALGACERSRKWLRAWSRRQSPENRRASLAFAKLAELARGAPYSVYYGWWLWVVAVTGGIERKTHAERLRWLRAKLLRRRSRLNCELLLTVSEADSLRALEQLEALGFFRRGFK